MRSSRWLLRRRNRACPGPNSIAQERAKRTAWPQRPEMRRNLSRTGCQTLTGSIKAQQARFANCERKSRGRGSVRRSSAARTRGRPRLSLDLSLGVLDSDRGCKRPNPLLIQDQRQVGVRHAASRERGLIASSVSHGPVALGSTSGCKPKQPDKSEGVRVEMARIYREMECATARTKAGWCTC